MALIFGSQFIGHFIRDWQTNEQGTGIEIGIRISIRKREEGRREEGGREVEQNKGCAALT